jgi:hypothetical protein
MKKALIPALLVVCAAFAACPRNAVEFPDRASGIARAAASPLFWRLWDELLARELARWTTTTSHDGKEPEWQPELYSDALVCLFFQVFKHAFDSSLATPEKMMPWPCRFWGASFVVELSGIHPRS